MPPPQVTEQGVHAPQGPASQSSGETKVEPLSIFDLQFTRSIFFSKSLDKIKVWFDKNSHADSEEKKKKRDGNQKNCHLRKKQHKLP